MKGNGLKSVLASSLRYHHWADILVIRKSVIMSQ